MQPDLNRVIEQVSKEKGIDRQIIVDALEEAMLSAAQEDLRPREATSRPSSTPTSARSSCSRSRRSSTTSRIPRTRSRSTRRAATLDPEAEVGDELLAKLPPEKFGRIAAQAAKQNIIQRVRDAERDIIYNEFKGRKGELFSGIVQRFEKKNIIVNLGRTDAILPEKEQIPRERYRQGDRIRAFILDVELTSKGPQIVLSRTHPGLLIKLFEQEVPEIYEGIVEVKGAAREPGGRAKIAVTSQRPRRRSGRRLRRHARHARAGRRAGAPRREDRHRPVDAGPGRVRLPRARAGQGVEDHHGRGRARDGGHRPRRPALARHRQEGPERPPRVAAHRLEARRPQRVRGRGRGAARARVAHRASRHRRRDGRAALPERLQVGGGAGGVRRGDARRRRRHRAPSGRRAS